MMRMSVTSVVCVYIFTLNTSTLLSVCVSQKLIFGINLLTTSNTYWCYRAVSRISFSDSSVSTPRRVFRWNEKEVNLIFREHSFLEKNM
jgi:hypothetical protein